MKRVLVEDGSELAEDAFRRADARITAAIAYVELSAAVAAAARDKRLDGVRVAEASRRVEQIWNLISEIPVDQPLLRTAGGLAEEHGLRAYDAVHLSALMLAGDPGVVSLACWDRDLRRAAGSLGYELIPAAFSES